MLACAPLGTLALLAGCCGRPSTSPGSSRRSALWTVLLLFQEFDVHLDPWEIEVWAATETVLRDLLCQQESRGERNQQASLRRRFFQRLMQSDFGGVVFHNCCEHGSSHSAGPCCICFPRRTPQPQTSVCLACCFFCAHATSSSGFAPARRRLLRMATALDFEDLVSTAKFGSEAVAQVSAQRVRVCTALCRPTGTLESHYAKLKGGSPREGLACMRNRSPPCMPTSCTQTSPGLPRMSDACRSRSALKLLTNSLTVPSPLSPCRVLRTTTRGCFLLHVNKVTRPREVRRVGVVLLRALENDQGTCRAHCCLPRHMVALARPTRLATRKASAGAADTFDASFVGRGAKRLPPLVGESVGPRFAHAADSGPPKPTRARESAPPSVPASEPVRDRITSSRTAPVAPTTMGTIFAGNVVFTRQVQRPLPASAVARLHPLSAAP